MFGFVKAAPSGDIRVRPSAALRLAFALATGEHPWLRKGGSPLELPHLRHDVRDLAGVVREVQVREALGHYADLDRPDVFRPAVTVKGSCLTWRPWAMAAYEYKRFIRVDVTSGEIRWSSGTGQPSRFIGSALVAAAGGMSKVPPGVLTFGF